MRRVLAANLYQCYITTDHRFDASLSITRRRFVLGKQFDSPVILFFHSLHWRWFRSCIEEFLSTFGFTAGGILETLVRRGDNGWLFIIYLTTMPGWRFKRPQKCQQRYSDWDIIFIINWSVYYQRIVCEVNSTRLNDKRAWWVISLLQSGQNESCCKANIHGTLWKNRYGNL